MTQNADCLKYIHRMPIQNEAYDFSLPQGDIASYLAASPETVCRLMRQLRERKIIAMVRKDQLEILDAQWLDRLAAGESV